MLVTALMDQPMDLRAACLHALKDALAEPVETCGVANQLWPAVGELGPTSKALGENGSKGPFRTLILADVLYIRTPFYTDALV